MKSFSTVQQTLSQVLNIIKSINFSVSMVQEEKQVDLQNNG